MGSGTAFEIRGMDAYVERLRTDFAHPELLEGQV
jgi:hypothetical protein